MNDWSANLLIAGYPRCITGFDLRLWPHGQKAFEIPRSERAATNDEEMMFPKTIDNQVWPRRINKELILDENGFNLFDGPLDLLESLQLPNDSILVAFDLPAAMVSTLASTFGIEPFPIGLLAKAKDWQFLGYDVVDPRTQYSAFYSFDWSKTELDEILGQLSLNLNANGLIDDELLGIKASITFDHLVKEHAPFASCGVWVKEEKKRGQATLKRK